VHCNNSELADVKLTERIFMSIKPDEIAAAGKAQLDVAVRLATIATQSAEKLFALQVKNITSTFDEAVKSAKILTAVSDISQLPAWAGTGFQPGMDKATAYAKNVCEIAAGAQQEVSALLRQQATEFNNNTVRALDAAFRSPAASEFPLAAANSMVSSIYDAFSSAATQFASQTQRNPATATARKKAA
jgi:phasin family protein